jgi:Zn-dependent M28 family amino/carboxypeptidase
MRPVLLFLCGWCAFAAPPLTPEQQALTDHITESSLRGHVSFLASDALEGRATPSPGQEIAAEYIAAQFRRAGLQPAGDDGGYFQTASFQDLNRAAQDLDRAAKSSAITRARLEAAEQHPGRIRNVVGLLRGSDPVLSNTYVILSAHYDHLGMTNTGADRIFNGANDDASGTASVIEIAAALSALPSHPKRSILFIAFFGEELGLVGSRYYARHPVVPLEETIADLNLEQVGRTDASNGDMTGTASITGFDFSDLPERLQKAGAEVGIRVYKDEKGSDPYFKQSDNLPLAEAGVVSHTLCVAFDFSDYHRVGDEWEKLNYRNMAAVDALVAVGLVELASDDAAPAWRHDRAGSKAYAEAAKKLHSEKP